MTNHIQMNIPAPDFVLKDVNNQEIHLTNYRGHKTIFLCAIRGFA
jgi:hypothetical protein